MVCAHVCKGQLAQMVRHGTNNAKVTGSMPVLANQTCLSDLLDGVHKAGFL